MPNSLAASPVRISRPPLMTRTLGGVTGRLHRVDLLEFRDSLVSARVLRRRRRRPHRRHRRSSRDRHRLPHHVRSVCRLRGLPARRGRHRRSARDAARDAPGPHRRRRGGATRQPPAPRPTHLPSFAASAEPSRRPGRTGMSYIWGPTEEPTIIGRRAGRGGGPLRHPHLLALVRTRWTLCRGRRSLARPKALLSRAE
jgi:hypothetical protein